MSKKSIVAFALAALVLGALPVSAAAHVRERRDERASVLARDLALAAQHLYSEAAHGRVRSVFHWRALSALRGLSEQARRFHTDVERYGAGHAHSRREFSRLEESFAVAQARAGWLRGAPGLRRDFERVALLMGRMQRPVQRSWPTQAGSWNQYSRSFRSVPLLAREVR